MAQPAGSFPSGPANAEDSPQKLFRVPINIVPGDVDGDGDLDVFIGQQKPGYFNGDIPTPYYDARDSFPCFLLLNDGQGNFTDVTRQLRSGRQTPAPKFCRIVDRLRRRRRSGFDHDQRFLGHGSVPERRPRAFYGRHRIRCEPQAHAFGMSHTFGDYDLDGTIDFLTVGMSSTTARRLEQLRLGRERSSRSSTMLAHEDGLRQSAVLVPGWPVSPRLRSIDDVARTGLVVGQHHVGF